MSLDRTRIRRRTIPACWRSSAVKCSRGEQPTIYGDGEQSRDFTYIENVVQANLLAAAAPAEKVSGRMMNAATGVRVTLNDTFAILKELTGFSGLPVYESERAATFAIRSRTSAWHGICWATSPLWISARA